MASFRVEDLQVIKERLLRPMQFLPSPRSPPSNDTLNCGGRCVHRQAEFSHTFRRAPARVPDRHHAHYVAIARGSSKEMKGHLRRALGYRFITQQEYQQHWNVFDEIAAMLTGLKNYLETDDRSRRG